jgi:hypothetical protein
MTEDEGDVEKTAGVVKNNPCFSRIYEQNGLADRVVRRVGLSS